MNNIACFRDAESASRLHSGMMKREKGKACEGDRRSWHIAIYPSDAAVQNSVA